MGGKQKKALARLHSAGIAQSGAALLRCRGRRLVRGPIRGALSRSFAAPTGQALSADALPAASFHYPPVCA